MLWCKRCKRRRERLANAFEREFYVCNENDRVSKRFECVVLDDEEEDEEDNEELNIFVQKTLVIFEAFRNV